MTDKEADFQGYHETTFRLNSGITGRHPTTSSKTYRSAGSGIHIDPHQNDDILDATIDPPRQRLSITEIKIRLYLRECKKLKIIPVSAYVRNPTSTALKISYYNIGALGARALAVALLTDTVMSSLDIEGNSITPVGLASIQEALTENVYITHLNIAENKLGHMGAKIIGLMMSTNTSMVQLNVARNGFGDQDSHIFAKIIKHNRHLRDMNLSGNEFGEIAGPAFGSAIASNETLEAFDVSWNHLRKQSAAEFALGIKENVSLKRLNLSFNGFGTEGTARMGEALANNRTLLELDMSKNRITNKDLAYIAKQLPHNETLEVLKLGHNMITPVGAVELLLGIQASDSSSLELLDLGTTSIDNCFLLLLNLIQENRNIKVKYGKVTKDTVDTRNLVPTYDTDSERTGTEAAVYADDLEGDSDEGDIDGDTTGEVVQRGDKDNEPDFDENKLDNEVKAVTGRDVKAQSAKTQEPLATDSGGTMTPDL